MERLLLKYTRYIAILAAHPGEPAVPTLDIDLAWHTHQLSPKSYLDYTVAKTGTLVDHSDRVDEDMLSIAFEWTSRVYSKTYGEAYSDCACWYCDSIRAMSSSGVTPMFQQSTEQNGKTAMVSSKSPCLPAAQSTSLKPHTSHHIARFTRTKPPTELPGRERCAKVIKRSCYRHTQTTSEGSPSAQPIKTSP